MSSTTHCFSRTENRSIFRGVVIGSEFIISHTFQRKRCISIAHTGNFILYALGPLSRKQSICGIPALYRHTGVSVL